MPSREGRENQERETVGEEIAEERERQRKSVLGRRAPPRLPVSIPSNGLRKVTSKFDLRLLFSRTASFLLAGLSNSLK